MSYSVTSFIEILTCIVVSDATILLRDIAGDATQKASGKLKPSENELSQIDQPAEENVWHEKPNISKEDIKAKFRVQAEKHKPAVSCSPIFGFDCPVLIIYRIRMMSKTPPTPQLGRR